MMHRVRKVLIPVILIAAVGGGGYYLWRQPQAWSTVRGWLSQSSAATTAGLAGSGSIEAKTVTVSSEIGGRIEQLDLDEGQEVEAGQFVARLSTVLVDAEIRQAEAGLSVAEAGQALAKAGASPQALAQADALVAQARAASEGAEQAWKDVQALLDAPQSMETELAAAQAQATQAETRQEIARLLAQAADLEQGLYGRTTEMLEGGFLVQVPGPGGPQPVLVPAGPANVSAVRLQWNLASQRTWQSYAALDQAKTAHEAALQAVSDLQTQLARPLTLEAQVRAAEAGYQESLAAVEIAQAGAADLHAGSRSQDLAVAQAAVDEARTALGILRVQRDKAILHAPIAGLVQERHVQRGETVGPGTPIVTLADLSQVTLTIYIPQPQLGQVHLGQEARVAVDAYAGQSFAGSVSWISDQAEFTPKSALTSEERADLVFAVRLTLPNPEHRLKPGMPADALLLGAGETTR